MTGTSQARVLTNVEQIWSRAVSSGTGTTVLALQMSKSPSEVSLLRDILQKLQKSHPILLRKLHYNPTTKEFSLVKSTTPQSIHIEMHDFESTSKLVSAKQSPTLSPCHLIMEHELNTKHWTDPNSFPCKGMDLLFASLYALSNTKCVVVLRLHVSICDRTTAVSVLRELMELVNESEGGGTRKEITNDGEGDMGIESLVPSGMLKKTFWAHGRDMLGYSLNSLRLTNLKFQNVKWPRRSEVVRLKMNTQHTARILAGCKSRGIKLFGPLAAAGLIAAHSTKLKADQLQKKYGVATLIDCRMLFEPALSAHHFGFFHSPLLSTQTLKGTENLWDLAERIYTDFARDKKCNKHFSDLSDMCYLMGKAVDNPSLSASSAQRTSLISVFEDPVIDDSKPMQVKIGVEDYIGCASTHGLGASIGIFDTIRNGELDCACVYPSPLHSRDQVSELVDHMIRILVDATTLK